ncbi:TIGR03086 family metal-binding protein [Nocardia sp. CDC153]|uniref:TIGR03086 family metal-binding protein n=1 Tax=Nocardia sp. CDC153 TaxID=3112167 RepID=UPI002DB78715|nr:TIGR03086 family metal-binding protein [Nocardia sp. CDC153]MEC3957582.1 TIGR03086 family metal-binding protein [Nocardia sp. CDC153]
MDIFELDRRALTDLVTLVGGLTDADLDRPTPCAGWVVRDLLRHMNSEHEAISEGSLNTEIVLEADPRKAFAQAASRWIEAFGGLAADHLVRLPKFGTELHAQSLLRVHFIDMLTHRWDLAKALAVDPALPEDLLAVALPIATAIPNQGPLRGPHGYAAPLPASPTATPTDLLVSALGRSPSWPTP